MCYKNIIFLDKYLVYSWKWTDNSYSYSYFENQSCKEFLKIQKHISFERNLRATRAFS